MEIPVSRGSAPRKALFVTFYSFKGGVGRSMALLNVASILARLGRRVLMVDFDLEAPGLTLFQDRQRGEGASKDQPGLVDALVDFLDTPETAALADEDPARLLGTYVTTLSIPEGQRSVIEGGQLDLLPTGRLDDDYESRLYRLPFRDLFERGVGVPMFEHLKGLIRDSDRYDYVLVDSRTGVSDVGSICTRYLADALVVVTGLNRQNLLGTARFLTQAGIGTAGPKRLAFVASPVPVFYEELTAERTQAARKMLEAAGLPETRFVAEIPYHPLLALDESPWDRDLSQTLIYDAYREITATLRAWADDLPRTRMDQAVKLLRQGHGKEALPLIREVAQEVPRLALDTLRFSPGLLEDVELEERHSVLEGWLDIARTTEEQNDISRALWELAIVDSELGRTEEAIRLHEEALDIAREIGDRWGEGFSLGGLGNRMAELGRMEKAARLHEEALSVLREVGDRSNEGVALSNLGIAFAALGREAQARNALEEARRTADELGQPLVNATLMVGEIEALAHLAPKEAIALADEVWGTVVREAKAFDRARAQVLRARLRAAHGNLTGAVEDAEAALALYRPNGVDSKWSREAEAIVEEHAHEA